MFLAHGENINGKDVVIVQQMSSIVYNIDCMEGMKQYPDKYFDLAVVDPPYGINVQKWHTHKRIIDLVNKRTEQHLL